MRRLLLVLIGFATCVLCGLLMLHHRLSPAAQRRAAFGAVEKGMTKAEVVAIFGPPTEEEWHADFRDGVMAWGEWSDTPADGLVLIGFEGEPARVRAQSMTEPMPWTERLWRYLGGS